MAIEKFVVWCSHKHAQSPGQEDSPTIVQFTTMPNPSGATIFRNVSSEESANRFKFDRRYVVEISEVPEIMPDGPLEQFVVICTLKHPRMIGQEGSPVNVQFHTIPDRSGATVHRDVKDEESASRFKSNGEYLVTISEFTGVA